MTLSSDPNCTNSVQGLMRAVQEFAEIREWDRFHNPKNLAMALASEVGELVALLRWVRDEDSDEFAASSPKRDELRGEIGDIGICLLTLCARVDMDFAAAVTEKLTKNASKYPVESSRGRADPPIVGGEGRAAVGGNS